MEQTLRDSLSVFPVPGRELGSAEVEAIEDAMRAEAYQEGYAAGRQEAEEAISAKESQIEKTCTQMIEQIDTVSSAIERSHRHAITEILKAVLPALARSRAADEIVNIIEQTAKGQLVGTTKIKSGIEFAEELAPRLENIDTTQNLALVREEEREGFSVDLIWEGGQAEIDLQDTVDQCLAALQVSDEI